MINRRLQAVMQRWEDSFRTTLRGHELTAEERDKALAAVSTVQALIISHSTRILPTPRRPSEAREILYRAGVPNVNLIPDGNLAELDALVLLRRNHQDKC